MSEGHSATAKRGKRIVEFGGKTCYRQHPPNPAFCGLQRWDWSGQRPPPLRYFLGALPNGGKHIIGGAVDKDHSGKGSYSTL